MSRGEMGAGYCKLIYKTVPSSVFLFLCQSVCLSILPQTLEATVCHGEHKEKLWTQLARVASLGSLGSPPCGCHLP